MFKFESGTLVKGAYVVIDGVEHEVHMPEYSGNTPLSPEILNKMQTDLLKVVFPIGSTYITQENTNPNSILGFGTWERLEGKVCLGLDEDDTDLDTIGKIGGEKEHTLTVNEMPEHSHNLDGYTDIVSNTGNEYYKTVRGSNSYGTGSTKNSGGGQSHNNMQPYEVVGYMWIRRA